jgi:hypothetical protein
LKKVILFAFVISLCYSAFTQNIVRVDTGAVNSARYKILFPKDWKHKLVMFAHGYDAKDNGRSKLLINLLEWDEEDWPVVKQFVPEAEK